MPLKNQNKLGNFLHKLWNYKRIYFPIWRILLCKSLTIFKNAYIFNKFYKYNLFRIIINIFIVIYSIKQVKFAP